MCRWITLLSSQEVSLADIVLTPSNSLVQLSKDASFHPGNSSVNNHVMNGDGFGVGWYHHNQVTINDHNGNVRRVTPPPSENGSNVDDDTKLTRATLAAVFKDTQPAWNNVNLRELCMATRSDCMIAHVRAASAGTGVSQVNCHPFKAGRLLFCHNGRIETAFKIRRAMMDKLTEEAFLSVRGTTDSELIFALILTFLTKDKEANGVSPFVQTKSFGYKRLVSAIKKALRSIEILMDEAGIYETTFSTFNFCLTDGDTVVVTRFCDKSPSVPPPSLYVAFGHAERLYHELTNEEEAMMDHLNESHHSMGSSSDNDHPPDQTSDTGSDSDTYNEKPVSMFKAESRPGRLYSEVDPQTACLIVASNPLTRTHTWTPLPKNSILWYERGSLPELRLLRGKPQLMAMIEE